MTPSHIHTYDPNATLTIRTLAPSLTIYTLPFLRWNRVKFGIRMTVIKLSSNNLAIFSPIPFTDEVASSINSLGGSVRYLIAPDIEHHMSLTQWKDKFPDAVVIGPEGLREKRAKMGEKDVVFDVLYTKDGKRDVVVPEEIRGELEFEYMDGHGNKEIAVLHKPTRTLLVADVIFNLYPHEAYSKVDSKTDKNTWFWDKLASFAMSVGKGQQRFIWYALAADKPSVADSARRIAEWDFERIVMAHGEVIETGGKEVFKRLYGWVMEKF